MKVVALQGSPRKKGNTAKVLSFVEEELIELGHEVETIYLNNKNIKGCLACGKCKEKPETVGCVQKDDAPEILQKMVDADLVIFASPLYFWGVTAQLKTIIDRTYSFYVNYHMPGHASLVEGKRQALLLTGGGPYENNAEATVTAFGRLQKPHMSVNAGELYIGQCSTPENMDEGVKEKSVAFARKISA
ncbi:NADPH-dependent FMN reductase, iron-sulfur flavoprotein [Desulfamplus magnetovallimortis]|uniref:NADPH-dependent FMN reductase, iron-sulfur flavoprotein n=1 Tax=Desulfamplus magnetovallimortis TaxID=1246637 RepID=A0A1W1HHH2_9BACT|nr:flavodoxin family protein [Desulfamplus magnetovallimortis]SLM31947.1 NADPH-dependent FMN reductase, iron-sulfur flavoprotein [Desulfamplus magnetovallimortis]